VEASDERIRVVFNGVTIADSTHALRVLETRHPPVYYIPRDDVLVQHLEPSPRHTMCEWKGRADYFNLRVGDHSADNAAFTYAEPLAGYEVIAGMIAFYASPMDGCFIGDELVTPQAGNFYAGWITRQVVGPFKGGLSSRRT
jgi:uncharacterized protein (DUF427 family)